MTATPPPGPQGPEPQQAPAPQQFPAPQQGAPQQWQTPPPAAPQQPVQQYANPQANPQGWAAQPAQQGWAQQDPQQLPMGEYGYQYGEMPHYPQPQFPPHTQQPRGGGVPGWMWAVAAVLVIAVVLVFAAPSFLDRTPRPDPTGDGTTEPSQEPTDGFGQENTNSAGTFTGEHMFATMNQALQERDRAAFFRFIEGDALEPLKLWWDNMEVLQWSVGAISLAPAQLAEYENNTIELRLTLGGVTAGSPQIPAESDHPDAGMSYAPSNIYRATIRVTDDGASGVITDWEITGTAAPWDLAPLYAVVSDHSVVAGYVDEKDLIDRVAPLGDEGATWVIETYERETGIANAQRFTTFVTEDKGRFNDWFITDTSGWVGDRAGTMFPQRRPYPADDVLATIAVGGNSLNAGGTLTVGPGGLMYGEADTLNTIVHEFIHAMHYTNTPQAAWPGSPATEGWATYNEGLFTGNGEFAKAGTYVGRMVRSCLEQNPFEGEFPTQDDFTPVETVHCAYMLSATMYAYAASLDADVYAAADHCMATGDSVPDAVAALGGPAVDASGWWSWVEATYGG